MDCCANDLRDICAPLTATVDYDSRLVSDHIAFHTYYKCVHCRREVRIRVRTGGGRFCLDLLGVDVTSSKGNCRTAARVASDLAQRLRELGFGRSVDHE
jgi:hypothetical protein